MSGSRPKPAEGHFAEEHLGDRLSALIDGELSHDSRERVLAHLATCVRCKAEADAQRRLKNVFAQTAPPPPSESFLARLQGLPGGGTDGGSPLDGSLPGGSAPGVFDVGQEDRFEFGYVPVGPHASPANEDRGFRIHHVGRPGATDRSASRGKRFAFAAAGAVSLAAVALGGVTAGLPADTGVADAHGGAGSVTPARAAGSGASVTPEALRRRSTGPLFMRSTGMGETAVPPTSVSAPLLPGVPSPATGQDQGHTPVPATPVEAGAAVLSPLIRPFDTTPVSLASWSTAPGLTPLGLLAVPVPDTAAVPTSSPALSPSPMSSSAAFSPRSAH